MFIRIKKSAKTDRVSIQIVENTRVGEKTKQRVIRHIGTASIANDIAHLRQVGEIIKSEIIFNNLCKLKKSSTGKYGSPIGKIKAISNQETIHLSKLEEAGRHIIGIHDVYGYIYDLLDFTNPFSRPVRREHVAKILREIVLCRIAHPCSKRGAVEKLHSAFGVSLNLDRVYQMMDKIDDAFCERIQERALAATLRLTGERLKVLFYDVTTLYFESFTEDELKQNGYSKDMKFNQPQVLLALFVTTGGLPVGYELFPGATYEGHTLKPVLEKLKSRYEIDEMIFVADRGMLSGDNLSYLEDNNIPYIVGARIKSLTKAKQKEILDWGRKAKKLEYDSSTMHAITASKRLILSYQKKRAEKDRHDREKSVLKLQQKLAKSSNPKNAISNYGYQKYLLIEGDAKLKINTEKLERESDWDGLSGVYTNQANLSDTEILNHYCSLWQIEESFRISKHDLSIRPIYHWTPRRVRAHIAISFMAFACVRHLEYRVKMQYKKLSPEVIREELLKVQASIIEDGETGKKYLLPSKLSQEAKQLYRLIGSKPSNQIQIIL